MADDGRRPFGRVGKVQRKAFIAAPLIGTVAPGGTVAGDGRIRFPMAGNAIGYDRSTIAKPASPLERPAPRPPAESKRKAFIAAPLIGTILFLSAVLFTVNLNKIESAQTARIVNDAYHNRVVSLIEIYRTDLSSVFRESVRRNIQEYILDPGWNTLDLSNRITPPAADQPATHYPYHNNQFNTPGQPEDFADYHDIRVKRCEGIRQLSREVVCSLGSKPVDASFGYGIPAWIEVANQEFSFQGIKFRPANSGSMALLNPDRNNADAVTAYANACRDLVQENAFDCADFADHPAHFQCKDAAGKPLPGCVEGTFFMKVDPQGKVPGPAPEGNDDKGDSALYAAMPRIEGDDGFGNQVRSGAIGDEPFYLPINLRVFYYDDFALEFYDKLAFNSDSSHDLSDPHGRPGGLVGGICSGTAEACQQTTATLRPPGIRTPLAGSALASTPDAAANRVATYFMRNAYTNGVRTLDCKLNGLHSGFCDKRTGDLATHAYLLFADNGRNDKCLDDATHKPAPTFCKDVVLQGAALGPDQVRAIPNLGLSNPQRYDPPSGTGGGYMAYYSDLDMHFFMLDERPEFKVSGIEPNHPSFGFKFFLNPG